LALIQLMPPFPSPRDDVAAGNPKLAHEGPKAPQVHPPGLHRFPGSNPGRHIPETKPSSFRQPTVIEPESSRDGHIAESASEAASSSDFPPNLLNWSRFTGLRRRPALIYTQSTRVADATLVSLSPTHNPGVANG
jgi:hypothetical protein